VTRSIHLRFGKLPSGLACYPRVVLTRRPPITDLKDLPAFHAHVERVKLRRDDIAKYAALCGFGVADGVPLTYPHIVAMPLHLKIFATEAFPLRPMGLIHLSNRIEPLGELQAGMDVSVETSLLEYRKTAAGIEFDLDSRVSSGRRALWHETSVFLSRWPDAAARGGTRPPRPPKAPKNAQVLEEFDVTLRTSWDYARVSNDFNPIHLSDRAARFFGLRGAISHGMWSLARSLAHPSPVPRAAGSQLETQFLTPVQLPARVAVKEWSEDGTTRRAMCDVRTGRVHMYAYWTG
jgi:acyl dehydratase